MSITNPESLFNILAVLEEGPAGFDEELVGKWIWALYRGHVIEARSFETLMQTPTWVLQRYYSV